MKNAGRQAGLSVEVVPVARDLSPRDFSARTRTGLTIALAPSEERNYFLIVVNQIGGLLIGNFKLTHYLLALTQLAVAR